MKKEYMNPEMMVIELASQQFLCGSITDNGSSLGVTIDDSEGSFGDDNTINSRGFDFWGNEE